MLSIFGEIADLRPHPARQIDQRLALIFRRMFLGVGIEDGALGFALFRQRHGVFRLGPAEQPGDETVFALIGRRWRAFAAHHAIDGFDRHLAGKRRRIGLPARNLALARLPRGGGDVKRLLHGLIDRLGRQVEQRADAGGRRGTEMGDMVDLVFVQANALHQIDLDFIGRGQPAQRAPRPTSRNAAPPPAPAGCCRRGANSRRPGTCRGNRVRGRRRRWPMPPIPAITLAGSAGRRPSRPAPADGPRLRPRGCDRMPRDRGGGNRGIVDDAVADHLGHLVLDADRVRGDGRDLPGELIGAIEPFGGFVGADFVVLHGTASSGISRRS